MINTFKNALSSAYSTVRQLGPRSDESLALQIGMLQAQSLRSRSPSNLREAEFKVFSQWGEDGIIQHLINCIPGIERSFVEFGVDDYSESNTRFLLMNDYWRGLIIDGGNKHKKFLQKQGYGWRYQLKAESAFITAENINNLISSAGFNGRLGLLSVDLDGVDYWVLEAITSVEPTIVIVEYNGFFGPEHAVTVPYRPEFQRSQAHYSNFYWGASLAAFYMQLNERGYFFCGCNAAGNNAFFVHRDCGHLGLSEVSVADGYVSPCFWEYRRPDGKLDESRDIAHFFDEIGDLPLIDVASKTQKRVSEFQFGSEL